MRQKDMTEKLLEDYEDVFADILNVLLFNGAQVIRPESLKEAKTKSQYKADDARMHEMERDVAKLWKKGMFLLHYVALRIRHWQKKRCRCGFSITMVHLTEASY